MPSAEPIFAVGARFVPDPSGALYWPEEDTLVVADMHLEKGSAFARFGVFLPPYDSRATLLMLDEACARFAPKRIVALGDSFHDDRGPMRLASPERALLERLCVRHRFVWIRGNHDSAHDHGFGGEMRDALRLGPLTFRHEPSLDAHGAEVAGHLHPCASLVLRGQRFRRRCFVSDGQRVILPAFGAYAGGLDVTDAAFHRLFTRAPDIWLIGRKRVHALGPIVRPHVVRVSAEATAPAASASTIASVP
jgi:hypothetical protein